MISVLSDAAFVGLTARRSDGLIIAHADAVIASLRYGLEARRDLVLAYPGLLFR